MEPERSRLMFQDVSAAVVCHHGGEVFVRFPGQDRLDVSNSRALFRQVPTPAEAPHLVLDLSGIDYVTGTALGELVLLHRRARSVGGRVSLANAGPAVREVLTVTRLDQLFDLREAAGDPGAAA